MNQGMTMIGQMMKVKTGNTELKSSFQSLFEAQRQFQINVTGKPPKDDTRWFQYHVTAMSEEIGEVLKADKRWKTHRNAFYDKENKLEEIADIFITAINISMFSGFDSETILSAIAAKISENSKKLKEAQK